MSILERVAFFLRDHPRLMAMAYWGYRLFQARSTLGVVGVVLNAEGKVLLVEHLLHPVHPWGLPGGWVNRNEDPQVAVVREFKEELGLDIVVKKVITVQLNEYQHLDIAFLCEAQGEIGQLSYELLGYEWTDFMKLPILHTFHFLVLRQVYAELKGGQSQ